MLCRTHSSRMFSRLRLGLGLLQLLLFMSIMFPTIFALGIADLGEDSATGASLLIMAIIGGAVFPPLMGMVSHGSGLQLALLLPLLCFGVVMLFARMATKKDQPS